MNTDLRLRYLRLKRHLLTLSDLDARRANRRTKRLVARLGADSTSRRGRLCRRSAALAA
jgi:hypothetical protein